MDLKQITQNKTFISIVLVIAVLFLIGLIIYSIKQHKKAITKYLYIKVKNATVPTHINQEYLPHAANGYQYSFSLWLNIQDWNYEIGKPKHVFHVGDKDAQETQPGVWIDTNENNIVIKNNNKSNIRFTTGKLGTQKDKKCVFPYKWSYSKLKVKEPNYITPELQKLGYKKGDVIPDTIEINKCESTTDKYAPYGYCPVKTDKYGYVESIKDFGTCNAISMNPFNNKQFFKDPTLCRIKNVPLKQWFHLAICIEDYHMSVYVNGKLVETCVADALPVINRGSLFVNQWGGFKGGLTQFRIFPFCLGHKNVWTLYDLGPGWQNDLLDIALTKPKLNLCQLCDDN